MGHTEHFFRIFYCYRIKIEISQLLMCSYSNDQDQWRPQEKISGVPGYGRPRRGSGVGAPRTPENLRKFAKKFLKKIAKKNALF